MHRLLQRQLRRVFKGAAPPTQILPLLEAVDRAYQQADDDRNLLERSLELTSGELQQRNAQLQAQLDAQAQIQRELESAFALVNATLESIGEGVLVFDDRGEVSQFNATLLQLFELKPDEMATMNSADFIDLLRLRALQRQRIDYEHHCMLQDPAYTSMATVHLRDERMLEYYSQPKYTGDQLSGRVWSFRDVTQAKRNEALLQHQAYHDALTGLPNRALFKDRLEHAIHRSQRHNELLAVLFMDLDRFKDVNDSLGHQAGDLLLIQAATRIRDTLREEDTLARLGGDEFIILLEDVSGEQQVMQVAERLIQTFATPFQVGEAELHVTTSIGVTLFPRDSDEVDALIRKADLAMYHAKETGRHNYQMFEPSLEREAMHRIRLESDLRQALDNNELTLHYQPQYDVRGGHIIGFEALLRWQRGEGAYVSPAEFIPIAEQSGQILSIGRWVLRESCRQLCAFKATGGEDLCMSINLSARQLQDPHLLDEVRQTLQEFGLQGSCIEFEITESMLMHNLDAVAAQLDEFHQLGIRIAIDDFGTGYSSLNYLNRLPIDALKIDKSFVLDLHPDADTATIASTVISMAHGMGLSVVAEGVENEATLNYLKQLDCDVAQGFLLCKPSPPDAVERLLANAPTGKRQTGP